jgi:hypothetical protein
MGLLHEIGERDHWRCWLCDEPVDQHMSVNDARGPSIDSRSQKVKGLERLAHRGCNTKKGAIDAVIAWPDRLFVSDPAPLTAVAERLARKGGREVVARCPTQPDADEAAAWLTDRFSRLAPELGALAEVQTGGGQFLVAVVSSKRRR